MSPTIFFLVLVAAAAHAGWNTLVKARGDPLVMMAWLNIVSFAAMAPLVPVVGAPAPAAWPFLAVSLILHTGYMFSLIWGYRIGDLGQVYPIARGGAPFFVTLASAFWLGEVPHPLALAGVLAISGGILVLAFKGARTGVLDRRSAGAGLLTALFVAGYILSDGLGARASGNASAYTVWLFVLDAVPVVGYALWRLGPAPFVSGPPQGWPLALVAGLLSVLSYWIAIHAMTVAPIALVAALRETSVLFASLFAVVFLKERLSAARLVGAAAVVAGAVALRLA